jgi:CNT family concentrative nucleoside transporter
LCGFANFASVGMVIGGLTALAPNRSKVFSKYAVKAMIGK